MEYYENRKDRNKFNKSFNLLYGEEYKSSDDNSKMSKSFISSNNSGINNTIFKSIIETKKKIFMKLILKIKEIKIL